MVAWLPCGVMGKRAFGVVAARKVNHMHARLIGHVRVSEEKRGADERMMRCNVIRFEGLAQLADLCCEGVQQLAAPLAEGAQHFRHRRLVGGLLKLLRGRHRALDFIRQPDAVDAEAELGAGARLLANLHVSEFTDATKLPFTRGWRIWVDAHHLFEQVRPQQAQPLRGHRRHRFSWLRLGRSRAQQRVTRLDRTHQTALLLGLLLCECASAHFNIHAARDLFVKGQVDHLENHIAPRICTVSGHAAAL
mmetsp:Transcript_12952/g.26256  ORF Transcript_12952/g.26256 Transcript_12952/m.26256 type:complete len:249 (+) Transcript_12952:210-956(+)